MFEVTKFQLNSDLLSEAISSIPNLDFKLSLNEPTGRFFYDPWKIKNDYLNTVWDKVLNIFPFPIGEARIILLKQGQCYGSHADIDNRYHLNLTGNKSFLIDLENKNMFDLNLDGVWYYMNAGNLHTAANFGNRDRYQLVVRELLNDNILIDPVQIEIKTKIKDLEESRFIFDNTVSPWLNKKNKLRHLTNFQVSKKIITFSLEKEFLNELKSLLPKELKIHHD